MIVCSQYNIPLHTNNTHANNANWSIQCKVPNHVQNIEIKACKSINNN